MIFNQFELKKSSVYKNQFIGFCQYWVHKNLPIILFACEFNIQQFESGLFMQMKIPLPEEIAKAVIKRKAEFLAGRYLAKQAAIALGRPECAFIEVKIGPHRAPVWPAGFKGSITHDASTAICIMSDSDNVHSLGIDIEHIITDDMMNDVASQVCEEQETQLIVSHGIDKNTAVTLIFSAKESIFKAFYPRVGEYFDFDVVTLKSFDMCQNIMKFDFNRHFAKKYKLVDSIVIDFIINNDVVLTAVIE